MRLFKSWYTLILFATLFSGCAPDKPRRVLIYMSATTDATLKASALNEMIARLKEKNVAVDTTSKTTYLTEDSLRSYGAIALFNLPQDHLDVKNQNDIERYFQAGGGLAFIHSATATPYQWPWLAALIGRSEIPQKASSYSFSVTKSHPTTKDMNTEWSHQDELVALAQLSDKNYVVVTQQGKPVSFYQERGAGRMFATLAGGTTSAFENDNFISHIINGIEYTLNGKALDYTSATTERTPEENRFIQKVLDTYLDEPIEMEIMADGRVIFIERHGRVKLFNPKTNSTSVIATFQVQLEGNYEDGLLGLELDPAFEKNQYIYLYYSPLGGEPVQLLSRFQMQGDSLLKNSEKVIMKVPVQRESCCHSAGNIYFGPDGNLYLSTGDNTSSKESDGYTPIDERPGRGPFDAQKSSGNTNDLRGKILRIRLDADGNYSIPDGNLFPKDGSNGKPEIYVMGARNPYRFTLDKRGFLYWGDVGPDGGEDSDRGPMSYDEWNQARKAGNFGWPYFVADNKAYADFDFATQTIGKRFDPNAPLNESPNNTGSRELPPAQPAFIYYPYIDSKEFPMLGNGSRSAMAGPFYYYDQHKNSTVKLPRYYDDKLFIFEWARNWIKVVSLKENGDLKQIETFLPSFDFWHPIDVKFGPDGALYVLQYGSNYFARNPDAQLVRIEFAEGNRQPVARIAANKTVGAAPLAVALSATESFDYDVNTKLQYLWDSGHGETSTDASPTFTYSTPGRYLITLTVTDDEGSKSTTTTEVKTGNETPVVTINVNGNRSFYFDNGSINYDVEVSDKEDGSVGDGIDARLVRFTTDYLKEGKDLALLSSLGASNVSAKFAKGKSLIDGSDCKSCHSLDKKSIGPTYLDVAHRYKGKKEAIPMLVQKIIKGGNGNWGHALMAAHPQLSEADTQAMVDYILSLAEESESLPLKGSFKTKEHIGKGEAGRYVITATYTDKGHEITGPLTGRETIILRHPKLQAEDFDFYHNVGLQRPVNGDMAYASDIRDGSYIGFKKIDLNTIKELVFNVQANKGVIEIRSESPQGPVLGTLALTSSKTDDYKTWRTLSTPIKKPSSISDLYFVFRNETNTQEKFVNLDWIMVR